LGSQISALEYVSQNFWAPDDVDTFGPQIVRSLLHVVDFDIQPSSSRFSKSLGHDPELRTNKDAHDFAQHLLTKAAERLRRGDGNRRVSAASHCTYQARRQSGGQSRI
jgi:hypothetical protein